MIHVLPVSCSEYLRLRELQNVLLEINIRYYLVPLFWFVACGRVIPSCVLIKLRVWRSYDARRR